MHYELAFPIQFGTHRTLRNSKAESPTQAPAAIPIIFQTFSPPVYLLYPQYETTPKASTLTPPSPPNTTISLSFFENFFRPFDLSLKQEVPFKSSLSPVVSSWTIGKLNLILGPGSSMTCSSEVLSSETSLPLMTWTPPGPDWEDEESSKP
jgi:hypothetical protein